MKPIHNVLTGRVAATVCAMLGVGFCATPALATTCVDNVRLLDGFTDQIGAICFDATGILSVGGSVDGSAAVVDGTGMVLTPGFIDTANAFGLVEISAEAPTVDSDAGGLEPVRASFMALDAYNPWSSLAGVARSGGVTGSVVVPSGGIVAGLGGFVHLPEGAPTAHVVEPAAVMAFHLDEWSADYAGGARGTVFGLLRDLVADAAFLQAHRVEYDRGQMRELAAGAADLDAIHRVVSGEVRALVHVNRAADIRTLLELSADWAQPPVIVGGAEAWAVAALLAERGATVVLNPLMNLPSSFDMLGARDDNAALLVAAGVPVAFASSDTHNARTVRQLAGNAVRAGLPYQAAIAGLTVEAAATAGVHDRFGRLQVGHVADLVLWTGDPLEFSSGVHAMWIQGEQQSLAHRQQALFERYRP